MGVNIPKLFRKISRPIILANLDVDLFNLSAKGRYICLELGSQGTYSFKPNHRNLLSRTNVLPKSTSTSIIFRTQDIAVTTPFLNQSATTHS